jgi:hypothetical protein
VKVRLLAAVAIVAAIAVAWTLYARMPTRTQRLVARTQTIEVRASVQRNGEGWHGLVRLPGAFGNVASVVGAVRELRRDRNHFPWTVEQKVDFVLEDGRHVLGDLDLARGNLWLSDPGADRYDRYDLADSPPAAALDFRAALGRAVERAEANVRRFQGTVRVRIEAGGGRVVVDGAGDVGKIVDALSDSLELLGSPPAQDAPPDATLSLELKSDRAVRVDVWTAGPPRMRVYDDLGSVESPYPLAPELAGVLAPWIEKARAAAPR